MGLAARQALGRSSWFGIAYEKNQLDCNLKSGNVIPPALFFFFEDWKTT